MRFFHRTATSGRPALARRKTLPRGALSRLPPGTCRASPTDAPRPARPLERALLEPGAAAQHQLQLQPGQQHDREGRTSAVPGRPRANGAAVSSHPGSSIARRTGGQARVPRSCTKLSRS